MTAHSRCLTSHLYHAISALYERYVGCVVGTSLLESTLDMYSLIL